MKKDKKPTDYIKQRFMILSRKLPRVIEAVLYDDDMDGINRAMEEVEVDKQEFLERMHSYLDRMMVHTPEGPQKFRTFMSRNGMDDILVRMYEEMDMFCNEELQIIEDKIRRKMVVKKD